LRHDLVAKAAKSAIFGRGHLQVEPRLVPHHRVQDCLHMLFQVESRPMPQLPIGLPSAACG
ncbi:hypothetical protein, partial [Mesorhizobium sp. M1E.F.Ca.ET.063.01.1.1]|uniref:hypothetical protein n=1 Tax=Mesorhizobium sp. M1E.F.Ca.ET.063.01.1.1 TaxID=2496750 RepID=UPI001AEC911F